MSSEQYQGVVARGSLGFYRSNSLLASPTQYFGLDFEMDLIGWVIKSRVICGVEAEAHELFSTQASVMFDEKQRFSESAQDWPNQVMRKVSFTQTVEPSIISGTANHFDNLV